MMATVSIRQRIYRVRGVLQATTLVLAGCGGDDAAPANTDTAGATEQTAGPDTSPVPRVGSGTGLADTDYVALDQDALRVQSRQLNINDDNPEQVLTGGLATALAWQPGQDSSQFDSFVRASSAWNNSYLRQEEQRLTTLVPMSMRDWTAWGDQNQVFYPEVTVTNETHPADTDTDFSRVVTVDMSTGTPEDPESGRHVLTLIGQVRVHHSPEGWRIDSFQVRDTVVGEN